MRREKYITSGVTKIICVVIGVECRTHPPPTPRFDLSTDYPQIWITVKHVKHVPRKHLQIFPVDNRGTYYLCVRT